MNSAEANSNVKARMTMNDDVYAMKSLSSAAPTIKSKVASVSSFADEVRSAKSSYASDEYVVNKQDKLNSLNSMAQNAAKYIPQLKDQANSNKAEYQRRSMELDEMDGTDTNIGAALAHGNSATSSESSNLNRAFQTSLF